MGWRKLKKVSSEWLKLHISTVFKVTYAGDTCFFRSQGFTAKIVSALLINVHADSSENVRLHPRACVFPVGVRELGAYLFITHPMGWSESVLDSCVKNGMRGLNLFQLSRLYEC